MFARRLACGAAAAALAMAAAPAVYAQVTTGGVTGRVTDASGKPVANATVVVRHVPSGTSSTTLTNGEGVYAVTNQRVGGPYTVTVTAPNYERSVVDIGAVGIGEPTAADVVLSPAGTKAVAEVVVTGVRVKSTMGPQSRINLSDVQSLPSVSRDIKDFVRMSPYVILDPTNSNALIIGGQNNRSNSILIDGVKQTDDFGLQANGYPTQRMPISLSVIQALNVDVAPYDAQFDGFQGGVVNVVTKSGGNDFHGEMFFEGTNQRLRGQKYFDASNTRRTFTTPFSEETYGITMSGPLIPDKLFFVMSYEEYQSNQPASFGPADDSNAASQIPDTTMAEAAQVRSIIQSHYGYDPLSYTSNNLPITDKKWFGKLDWNITDRQRAVFEFQSTKGASQNNTGESQSSTTPSLALLSKWYNLETDLTVYTGQLFSHWTDNFSTTLMVSRKEAINDSEPLAGTSFAQFQVYMPGTPFHSDGTPGTCTSGTPCPSIILGPDISRMANALSNISNLGRFKADYQWGNHTITAGLDLEKIDVYNLFVQNANGAYVFNSINDLQNGNAFSIKYQNAADNIKSDGAARFSFMQNAAYLQDEWAVTPELTIRAGIRDEWYSSGSKPLLNQVTVGPFTGHKFFTEAYGFDNNKNLDGMQVVEPRFGFNWRPDPTLSVYGGAGLFQGGTPNVWVSNSYSNPGNLIGVVTLQCPSQAAIGTGACDPSLLNVNGFSVGSTAQAANSVSANTGTGNTNAIAPGFEPASIWKESLGVKKDFELERWRLGANWHVGADFLNSQVNNALYWQDLYQAKFNCAVTGQCSGNTVAPDGRPEYGSQLPSGTLFGTDYRQNRTDVVFLDSHKGYERQYTLWLEKDFREGFWDGLKVAYSFTGMWAKDVNPGTSSVATSNFRQVAITDFNNPALSNSNYLIKNAYKLTIEYDHKWFGDNMTRIGIFAQQRSGLPYSYTFQDSGFQPAVSLSSCTTHCVKSGAATGMFGTNSLYTGTNAELLYIPKTDGSGNVTLTSDPIVAYKSGFDINGFNTFLHQTGLIRYAGQITPRNAFFSKPVGTIDLHFSQEFPVVSPWKGEAYMDIINVGNLIDPHWGVLQQVGFPYFLQPINAQNCQAGFNTAANCKNNMFPGGANGNYYQFNSFTTKSQIVNSPSPTSNTATWAVKLGLRFKF